VEQEERRPFAALEHPQPHASHRREWLNEARQEVGRIRHGDGLS
jgi:hypothetical protein